MSNFDNIKKWMEETREESLEEMGGFFRARVDGYESHMDPWKDYYKWMADLIPESSQTLLDIGCGTGLELDEIFKKYPDIKVTGIDLESSMLQKLKEKHRDRKLNLICGDYFIESFGVSKYDTAVSFETLHHFRPEKKIKVFRKIYNSLKTGGCYIEGDYAAESEEMEVYLFEELKKRKAKNHIPDNVLVHFDTPLTLEHEMLLLKKAAFKEVISLGDYVANNTMMIKAIK
ncbi:class I SAM-dependent methyltransferase [Anaerocolumna sp. MB42-C2]|uniref:class I SAM-dependent methyltransferase n=1 Tax=Anaerocolumna sp. MB42-C2 TaxID=3070997 RepID=UPI0027E097FD|nr:class I SAM-dependent methyltransferase [Anaerocolumna sp. MB42-C2]WMJ90318.1 class I SAM-dependent methyltransferase [Anaerocolumna sp. MB42-C2]